MPDFSWAFKRLRISAVAVEEIAEKAEVKEKPPKRSLGELEEWCKEISHLEDSFQVTVNKDRKPVLWIFHPAYDSDHPDVQVQAVQISTTTFEWNVTYEQFIAIAWDSLRGAILHEAGEFFWVNGERPYHPHRRGM